MAKERKDVVLRMGEASKDSVRITSRDPSPELASLLAKGRVSIGELEEVDGVRVKAQEGRVYVEQPPEHYAESPRFRARLRPREVEGVKTCSRCGGSGWLDGPNRPPCKDCKITGFEGGVLLRPKGDE